MQAFSNRLFLIVGAAFGDECGTILHEQAECEDKFQSTNMPDGMRMEPLDSDLFTPELRRNARENAMAIEKNIKKLVRIFTRKDMRDKLVKEFGAFKTNEIASFKGSFERMNMLYKVKNGTSLVDHLAT